MTDSAKAFLLPLPFFALAMLVGQYVFYVNPWPVWLAWMLGRLSMYATWPTTQERYR